jgi:hypothetical protein
MMIKLIHGTRGIRIAVIALLASGVAITGNAIPAAAQASLDDATTQTLSVAAQEFLQSRASALLSGQAPAKPSVLGTAVSLAGQLAAQESAGRQSLTERRERLWKYQEAYSAARTAVTNVKASRTGDRATLTLTETTTLDYLKIRGDEPPYTAYSVEREFTFAAVGDAWQLTGQRILGPDGLAPVTEPSSDAPAGLSAAEPGSAAPGFGRPAGTADKATSGKAFAAYDYSAMAAYAERYWSSYNTAYRTFADRGGDCTNFISQALRAGGWAFINGLYTDYRYWWYNSLNQTRSWINVDMWASFTLYRGRAYNLQYLSELGLADILQMDFDRASGKDHSMIVSYLSGGTAYLTYHTTNTYRRSVWSIYESYPNALYYAFRT